MSNIQSLAMHLDQLLKQHEALKRHNNELHQQVAQLEQQLVSQTQAPALSTENTEKLMQLHDLVDAQLSNI